MASYEAIPLGGKHADGGVRVDGVQEVDFEPKWRHIEQILQLGGTGKRGAVVPIKRRRNIQF